MIASQSGNGHLVSGDGRMRENVGSNDAAGCVDQDAWSENTRDYARSVFGTLLELSLIGANYAVDPSIEKGSGCTGSLSELIGAFDEL